MLMSSLALFKSSVAAFRFSLESAMLLGICMPVNKGTLVLRLRPVFCVLILWYVLLACKLRPKLKE